MAHEIAKLMLEHAGTFLERSEAVKTALFLGMPLGEIEEYLDWLDAAGKTVDDAAVDSGTAGNTSGEEDRHETIRPPGQYGNPPGPFGYSHPTQGPAGS
ncbi:MAG: hypothetical protein JW818_19525 [Pirellulales bacterium]|nr:hypothetical protein [Pirellulales bacterium]